MPAAPIVELSWRRRDPLAAVLVALVCAVFVTGVRAQTAAPPAAITPPAAAAAPTAAAQPAQSSQPTQLDAYLDNLKTLRASFLQTLADGQGHEIDRATGKIIVQRPGRFSWEIHPQTAAATDTAKSGGAAAGAGTGQLMVCDGRNLWFFDRDLGQVTVKPVDDALSATPAMLLSGAVDVRKNFTISAAGERMGLSWVLVEPHGTEADFREALFGFDKGELKRMILEDKLDQTATVIFDKIERNTKVSAAEVSFTPPPGADLIGTPRK
jgi:outer membrane lipoprotein carrier protein